MSSSMIGRRDFMMQTAALAAGAGMASSLFQAAAADAAAKPFKTALIFGMLPKDLSEEDRFKLAKKCGFEGIESEPVDDLAAAKKRGDLAKAAGVPIHSVIYGGWDPTLTDPDTAKQEAARAKVESALRSAQAMGADNILLVPGVVKGEVTYDQAWERSTKHIRTLIPVAEELKVIICIEEVWNNFLLDANEMAKYVDQFNSPWVRAYFDIANVVKFAEPQAWIRTLGKRIYKVHVKEYKKADSSWPNLGEGDVNWPEVRKAFAEVGYQGFGTAELGGGDEAYLTDLRKRMDTLLNG
ncbi:MAG: sugar phosphate isomerase/epimerase [Candidatus Hydrogenedentes bacterium]|nr:sugar phosphate isomerase/epimerase [Candidatus Hydrogenedentota bacterium]